MEGTGHGWVSELNNFTTGHTHTTWHHIFELRAPQALEREGVALIPLLSVQNLRPGGGKRNCPSVWVERDSSFLCLASVLLLSLPLVATRLSVSFVQHSNWLMTRAMRRCQVSGPSVGQNYLFCILLQDSFSLSFFDKFLKLQNLFCRWWLECPIC